MVASYFGLNLCQRQKKLTIFNKYLFSNLQIYINQTKQAFE